MFMLLKSELVDKGDDKGVVLYVFFVVCGVAMLF